MTYLDSSLPHYHFREHHQLLIPGELDVAVTACRELKIREVSSLIHCLTFLRSLPGKLLHQTPPSISDEQPFLTLLNRNGFIILEDKPQELVLGCIGKFWKLRPEILRLQSPAQFATFGDKDFAKVAVNLLFTTTPGGTVVSTETRIMVAEKKAHRAFAIYWVFIRLGSGLIRRLWLRAIRDKVLQTLQLNLPIKPSSQRLLYLCGITSALFGIFHALFWPLLHWPHSLAYMLPEHRMLMQTFGLCMTPIFFVLAWGYFRYPVALVTTALGRCFSMIPISIFLFRAIAELLFGHLKTLESWFFFILSSLSTLLFIIPILQQNPVAKLESRERLERKP